MAGTITPFPLGDEAATGPTPGPSSSSPQPSINGRPQSPRRSLSVLRLFDREESVEPAQRTARPASASASQPSSRPSSSSTGDPGPLLKLKLSGASFLDTVVKDDTTKEPLYIVQTEYTITSVYRLDKKRRVAIKAAAVQWPTNVIDVAKTKGKGRSGKSIQLGGSWRDAEDFLRLGPLGNLTSRKFTLPQFPHSLKWKFFPGNSYFCTTSGVKGPVAVLDPSSQGAAPRLHIYHKLLSPDLPAGPGGVPLLLLDHLVLTALLLATSTQEWLDRPPGAHIPGETHPIVQRWLKIIRNPPSTASPTATVSPSTPASSAASSSSSTAASSVISSGASTLAPPEPGPERQPSPVTPLPSSPSEASSSSVSGSGPPPLKGRRSFERPFSTPAGDPGLPEYDFRDAPYDLPPPLPPPASDTPAPVSRFVVANPSRPTSPAPAPAPAPRYSYIHPYATRPPPTSRALPTPPVATAQHPYPPSMGGALASPVSRVLRQSKLPPAMPPPPQNLPLPPKLGSGPPASSSTSPAGPSGAPFVPHSRSFTLPLPPMPSHPPPVPPDPASAPASSAAQEKQPAQRRPRPLPVPGAPPPPPAPLPLPLAELETPRPAPPGGHVDAGRVRPGAYALPREAVFVPDAPDALDVLDADGTDGEEELPPPAYDAIDFGRRATQRRR